MQNKGLQGWVCRNAANAITLFGILLNQVVKVIIFVNPEWINGILAFASITATTDWIDGRVARYFEKNGYIGSVSEFGKTIDRFRDKDLIITVLLFLVRHPLVDHRLKWIFCLLVAAEVILLVALFVAVKKKTDTAAAKSGKRKMVLECSGILAGLFILAAKMHRIAIPEYVTYTVMGVSIAAVFFAAMSIKGHVSRLLQQQVPFA